MKILLTFTGFHDPYSTDLVGEEELGPILSLVRTVGFDRVVLFSTPNTAKNTAETASALHERHSGIVIESHEMSIVDPTDYVTIIHELRKHARSIVEKSSGAEFSVAVASGTPQMHACWLLLVASGEIPAKILHVRPQRFVTAERPIVSEVDMSNPAFPIVRKQVGASVTAASVSSADPNVVARELGIVADHPSLQEALDIAATLAASKTPMLILGETGTGKELLARYVHALSGRPADKFVAVNCAALPKDLVESLLFGHKKGTFTGATSDQVGKFDFADGGTLFLDELGDLPLETQAKLLRVLQDGLLEPLGASKPHKVDVRIVAATNVNLGKAIRQGKFREDLYYRLNVGELRLPALRERRSDIPTIALHVLDRINSSLKVPRRLTPDTLSRLQSHDWPGNIRELANVVERSVRLSRSETLHPDDILLSEPVREADPLATLPEPREGFVLEDYLASARKQLMLRALEMSKGNQSEAARLLGITPQAVHKFIQVSRK